MICPSPKAQAGGSLTQLLWDLSSALLPHWEGRHLSREPPLPFPMQIRVPNSLGPRLVTLEASRKFPPRWPQCAEMAAWQRGGQAGMSLPMVLQGGSCAGYQPLAHSGHPSSLCRIWCQQPITPTPAESRWHVGTSQVPGVKCDRTWAVHTVAKGETNGEQTQVAVVVTAVLRDRHRKGTCHSLKMTAMWSGSCPEPKRQVGL